jgi:Bacterial PH domain
MSDVAPGAVFRVPRPAYLVIIFMAAGVWPIALYGGDDGSGYASPARLTPLILLFVVPVVAIVFIARTATLVDADGITVRAAFGHRRMRWDQIRGLSVTGRSVYAVLVDGGSVRLPCVGVPNLGALARASGGRLPKIADPTPKFAPSRRRRR